MTTRISLLFVVVAILILPNLVLGLEITPSPYWKNQISFPDDSFLADRVYQDDPAWVKFTTLILEDYDPNLVYFQDCQQYIFHYDFATTLLNPFVGITPTEYSQVSLYQQGQQASLGTVIMPPVSGFPPAPVYLEYGIQFVRYDAYTKEEIRDMFNLVKSNIIADPNVMAFYFPTYEQQSTADANRDWFESEGIPISSTARWAEGNVCYSEGWALGELKFFEADQIDTAFQNGYLLPSDILLTDAVPAEIPSVAGIMSLSPSTPSSHVAILAQTYGVPFAYLALTEDADYAQQLLGRRIAFTAYDNGYDTEVKLINVEGVLTEAQIAEILELKTLSDLNISPIALYGAYTSSTNTLVPADIQNFGGKAANYGVLRQSIPANCPEAIAISFDLWNEFLDQTIIPRDSITIEPNGFKLFWADRDIVQGSNHADFKLDDEGEYIGLYDRDGTTLIDGLSFGLQSDDVSYGRSIDGGDTWQFFGSGNATPGNQNSPGSSSGNALVINEFMAENDWFIQDNFGEYDDWLELYNASGVTVDLSGMYLTDDPDDPTDWMIPPAVTGSTLREEIANRLSGYTYPPADMAALAEDLSAIRSLFKNTYITNFTPDQKTAIETALQSNFDVNEKIRFRSSTNVEDSDEFTGAGLYDSYSGCLADDLDGDDDGPCICDPTEVNERGVFRAIRKVFASFYNDNAFLERLHYGVDPNDVGMAVLVHHSFPDEIELANGVATLTKGSGSSRNIMLVTQLGATSVANPEPGSIPEEVSIYVSSSGTIYPTLEQSSSLVPLGAKVMQWTDDYTELSQMLLDAAERFELVTGKTQYVLDFEYKKVAPGGAALPAGGLVVKQIREIPQPDTTKNITPFLINKPTEYCNVQGEIGWIASSVFAGHRLKSRFTLETKNTWLNDPNLAESFFANAQLEYVSDGRTRNIAGKLPLLPFASHTFDGSTTDDYWRMHHLANPRNYELQTMDIPTLVSKAESPLLILSDLGLGYYYGLRRLHLNVEHDQPVITIDWQGIPTTTTTENVSICPCIQPRPGDLLQERAFYDDVKDINITTSFYWPPYADVAAGYTAPLSRFVETVIDGYTTDPIVLHNYYSQTYGPGHHNFDERFIFEPQLELDISQDTLDELKAQDIRLIHMYLYGPNSYISTFGFTKDSFIPGDHEPDGDVDLADFANVALHWLDTVCDDCGKADLTGDGNVWFDDFSEFTYNWLAGVE